MRLCKSFFLHIVVVVLLTLTILVQVAQHFHWGPFKEVKPQAPYYWRNDVIKRKPIQLPRCLVEWRQETMTQLLSDSSPYIHQFVGPSICSFGFTQAFVSDGDQHPPHFIMFFNFFVSLMLWQDTVEFPNGNKPCISHFLMDESYTTFWYNDLILFL